MLSVHCSIVGEKIDGKRMVRARVTVGGVFVLDTLHDTTRDARAVVSAALVGMVGNEQEREVDACEDCGRPIYVGTGYCVPCGWERARRWR